MIELLKSIKNNYDIFIDTNKIHKLGATTINDIFLINFDNKKYRVYRIYCVKQKIKIEKESMKMKDIIKTKSLTKYIKNKAIKEIALFCCAFIFVVCYANIYFF